MIRSLQLLARWKRRALASHPLGISSRDIQGRRLVAINEGIQKRRQPANRQLANCPVLNDVLSLRSVTP